MIADWLAFWAGGTEAQISHIRQHTRTGRPLDTEACIEQAEKCVNRVLRCGRLGPTPPDVDTQPGLEL